LSAKFFVAILGPTATGKSALGLALAERYRGEIVNCDSTAVYRGFDIGTDKVPLGEQRGIPHHLIDVVAIDALKRAHLESDAGRFDMRQDHWPQTFGTGVGLNRYAA